MMRSKSKEQPEVAMAHPDDPDGLAPLVVPKIEAAMFAEQGWSEVEQPGLAGQKVPEGDVLAPEDLEKLALAHEGVELVEAPPEIIEAFSTGGVPLTDDQIPAPVHVLQFDRIPGDEDPEPLPPIILGPLPPKDQA